MRMKAIDRDQSIAGFHHSKTRWQAILPSPLLSRFCPEYALLPGRPGVDTNKRISPVFSNINRKE
jgi:hypothetical protein